MAYLSGPNVEEDPAVSQSNPRDGVTEDDKAKAAGVIQRNYRGHRTRRGMNGFGLDASTRWMETLAKTFCGNSKAVKDAQYQNLTKPTPPMSWANDNHDRVASPARTNWNRVAQIARRAGADDKSDSASDASSEDISSSGNASEHLTHEERQERRQRRLDAGEARKKNAKMMDLQYFLEMVDQKHRYGSNLRKYHAHWKTEETKQNFFYWLDLGEGKNVELPECSRERLNKEQVRYLSREERLNYLVIVGDKGRLVWAKNGEKVWTKDELYKDSIKGILPVTDPTPQFRYNIRPEGVDSGSTTSESEADSEDDSDDDSDENTAGDEGERYVNEDFHRARGLAKVKHLNTAVIFNHLVRKSLKKGHKWIFVADTSFRLYVGYKQSGAFQHSSFLHGSRITAAGLIKIKRGVLRSLSPLSGHYRPPVDNFRSFVHSLRDEGVDMSRVSISQSYTVLVGMESYTRTMKKIKSAESAVAHEKDKLFHPEKVRAEEEDQRDKSQSAEKERQHLEKLKLEQEKEQEGKVDLNKSKRLSKVFSNLKGNRNGEKGRPPDWRRIPGTGPEDGIPAPEGKR